MNKTPITDPIAIEELLWVQKDGNEILITAKVGRPYKVDDDIWACPAELCGVDNQYPDMRGVGSMHALGLALSIIKKRLGHLIEDGEKLYYSDDKTSKFDKGSLDLLFGKNN